MSLTVAQSQLCRAGYPCLDGTTNKRITYWVESFGLDRRHVRLHRRHGQVQPVHAGDQQRHVRCAGPPGASANETVTINAAEWAQSPALGLMVVTKANASGKEEAQLIKVDPK